MTTPFSSDFLTLITNDAAQGISRVPGLCTPRLQTNDVAVVPVTVTPPRPPSTVISTLNNNISALSSFCFLVTARTDVANTNPFFRLFNNRGIEIGSLTVRRNTVSLTLFSSTATFERDLTGSDFKQFQICVDNNRATLHEDCVQVGGTQPFSTAEFPSRTADLVSPASLILFQNLAGQNLYQVGVLLYDTVLYRMCWFYSSLGSSSTACSD